MSNKSDDTNEDSALWALITKTVKPLKNDKAFSEPETTHSKEEDFALEQQKQEQTEEDKKQNRAEETKFQNDGIAYSSPSLKDPDQAPVKRPSRDIDKRSLQKLKRGQYKIEGRLDLHGMTQIKARDTLFSFLQASYHQGKRCVLVITGKGRQEIEDESGYLLHQEKGVLKKNLPVWLNDPSCRDIVLQHSQAQPKHGGGGAFYVLLRRNRGR